MAPAAPFSYSRPGRLRMSEPFFWRGRAVRGVLLDMDGTLVDSRPFHGRAWEAWAKRRGISMRYDEYLANHFGCSDLEFLPELFPHLAGNRDALREVAMEREEVFLRTILAEKPDPIAGVPEFVARATARGIPMAVASNAPRENVEGIVAHLGLADAIGVRLSIDDVEQGKPAPDLYLEAAQRLGIPPPECVVIEDSVPGLRSGVEAGARAVAILTGIPRKEALKHAEIAVEDFRALLRHPEWETL